MSKQEMSAGNLPTFTLIHQYKIMGYKPESVETQLWVFLSYLSVESGHST